jgi:hypothetical protein
MNSGQATHHSNSSVAVGTNVFERLAGEVKDMTDDLTDSHRLEHVDIRDEIPGRIDADRRIGVSGAEQVAA